MADMIARLKVDSSEYDAKIKRAAQGLQHFVNTCHEQGDVIGRVLGDTRKYVESLGNMGTVATTVRGRIAELTSGFIEIKSVYNSLSEEEKKAPFGKELSKQLDIMKGRITDAKKELADINKELEQTDTDGKNLGGVIDQLAGKFGISTKTLTTWGVAIGAGTTALKVAKDAFMKNEEQLDEWGRVVESAESIYSGFLSSLNNGDISGFLSRIDEIVSAARNAYNALDELNTFNAFNQVNVEKTRTGMTEAIVDYREGNGSKESVRAAGDAYKKELEERRKLENQAYLDAVKKIASERGVSYDDLLAAMSGSYGNYKDLKNVQPTGTRITTSFQGVGMAPLVQQESYATTRQEKLGEALRQLNDTELKSLQALGAQAERTGNEIAQVDRQLVRVLNGRQGAGGGSGKAAKTYDEGIKLGNGMDGLTGATIVTYESMEELQRQLSAYKTALNRSTNAIDEQAARQGIAATEWKMSAVGRSAAKLGWSQEDMGNVAQEMEEALYSKMEPVEIDFAVNTDSVEDVVEEVTENTKEMANAWNDAGSAIKNVGSLLSQIEDPAAKVAGIIAEAIASIALTFAQSLKGTVTPWDWIAGAASGTATMISTIAAIKSATSGYANGGIVQGTSRTGDNNLIRANAGELILTEGQQGTIAKTLVKAKEAYNIEFGTLTNIATEIANLVGEINLTLNTKILEALNKVQDYTELTSTWAIIGALMPFAHGGVVHAANGWSGIVPGNLMSGDHVPALLDSGEVVLNRAQTSALAADLQRNDQHGATAQPYVSGEQIYLGLNNYLKRSGRGEIVTSRG